MSPTLRQRLAARHFEIPDPVRRTARRAGSLSKAWRKDAAKLGRKAMRMEHRVEDNLHGWVARIKPKVVRVEHGIEDAVRSFVQKVRHT